MGKRNTAKENWEALEPLAKKLKKAGRFYTPLHDYKKLRDTREEFYDYKLSERLYKLPDSSKEDIILFRLEHLEDELEIIKGWKAKEQTAVYSTELAKYRNYVVSEKGKARKKAEEPTFEGLFSNPDHPKIVTDYLEIQGYTEEGKWVGVFKGVSEFVSLFHVLMVNNILNTKVREITPHQIVFFKHFGLNIGKDVSEGHARLNPGISKRIPEAFNNFENALIPLLKSKNNY